MTVFKLPNHYTVGPVGRFISLVQKCSISHCDLLIVEASEVCDI
jgi:hypothetical protein